MYIYIYICIYAIIINIITMIIIITIISIIIIITISIIIIIIIIGQGRLPTEAAQAGVLSGHAGGELLPVLLDLRLLGQRVVKLLRQLHRGLLFRRLELDRLGQETPHAGLAAHDELHHLEQLLVLGILGGGTDTW